MFEVPMHQGGRIVDAWAVRRKELARLELEHALERREVLREVAPVTRRDVHAAAGYDEVAGVHAARGFVPEGDVIGRVTRSVYGPHQRVADPDFIAVGERP